MIATSILRKTLFDSDLPEQLAQKDQLRKYNISTKYVQLFTNKQLVSIQKRTCKSFETSGQLSKEKHGCHTTHTIALSTYYNNIRKTCMIPGMRQFVAAGVAACN